MVQRHITGLYALRRPLGGSGFSRLGHFALLIPTAPSPTFGRAVFALQSPFVPAQTSHTAGTLCVMGAKFVLNPEN